MTVMPSSSDVADKAVSTEDASSGVEMARLEAVLAALVETKVEAMKASSSLAATAASTRRAGSAPASPRRPRLTSSSTVSSSQNHRYIHGNHHHHHHHHHHHRHHPPDKERHDKKDRHSHRHRRHGSAPCGDYIEDPVTHHHRQRHGKGKQKSTDSPRSTKKRRRHSKSPRVLSRNIHPGIDSRFELLEIDADQDLALINFERTREALSDSCEYPRLHRSACYISHSTAQLKSHYDEDDYLAFNFADDHDEDETFSGPNANGAGCAGAIKPTDSRERFHRPRKKRKRRKRKALVDVEGVEVELGVDPDDLPPRARWTIVATACLLLAMSLLLVGVTLRMAPIIDEMVRKENEELLNSLKRDSSTFGNTTSLPP